MRIGELRNAEGGLPGAERCCPVGDRTYLSVLAAEAVDGAGGRQGLPVARAGGIGTTMERIAPEQGQHEPAWDEDQDEHKSEQEHGERGGDGAAEAVEGGLDRRKEARGSNGEREQDEGEGKESQAPAGVKAQPEAAGERGSKAGTEERAQGTGGGHQEGRPNGECRTQMEEGRTGQTGTGQRECGRAKAEGEASARKEEGRTEGERAKADN